MRKATGGKLERGLDRLVGADKPDESGHPHVVRDGATT
jgi:hypothetical protein